MVISLHKGNSIIYYVISDDDDDRGVNTFSLQHYLNNISKYFISHNQFHFAPGQYYINDDLIFKDITDFSVMGYGINQCVFICTSSVSIVLINVSSAKFQNINLINCTKHPKEYFNMTYYNPPHIRDSVPFGKIADYHTSVFLFNSSVTMYNMNIIATVITSFTAILVGNTQDSSKIINIKVQLNSFNCTTFNNHPMQISGLTIYYRNWILKESVLITITNFYYNNTYKSCANHFHYVIILLFLQNRECKLRDKCLLHLSVHIQNSVFNNFKNSSIVCYYGEADGKYDIEYTRKVIIKNSTFSNNTGHPQLNMFDIVLIH